MVLKKGKDGTWILKKKFTFASVVLTVITIFAFRGFVLATTVAEFAMLMTAYATASGGVLLLIFGADVADKKLNGGKYNLNDDYYSDRYGDPRR
ncbi:MAG: hypothetical protein IH825_07740 [Candidatus Marinimicrobia bacterium]|nr:hypothetical protein [Candidatus Neomarinimicrobiota bacterium]